MPDEFEAQQQPEERPQEAKRKPRPRPKPKASSMPSVSEVEALMRHTARVDDTPLRVVAERVRDDGYLIATDDNGIACVVLSADEYSALNRSR